MHFSGLIGIAAIGLLAWAMSYHSNQVRLRPIAWGLALQVLLGISVLREDTLGFVGLGLLALLITIYLLDAPLSADAPRERANPKHRIQRLTARAVVASAVGGLLWLVPEAVLASVVVLAVAVSGVVPVWRSHVSGVGRSAEPGLRIAQALIVVGGATWLISHRITGRFLVEKMGREIGEFLLLTDYGTRFLFGPLADSSPAGFGFVFAFAVLPIIVFFAAFASVLFHFGIVQRVIEALSRFLSWTAGTSGAETLCATANIFLGQTEAPLLIRPYLAGSTRSELITVMISGFATIAGSGFAIYAAMGIPIEHLVAASVMSAPAAIVIAKIVFPELEHPETAGTVRLPTLSRATNVIEAVTQGISDGTRLAVNVAAMLIGFISFIAVADVILSFLDGWIDGRLMEGALVQYSLQGLSPVTAEHAGFFPGSLQTLFGHALRPAAWLLGVPWNEAATVGNLLGLKLALNEFVAYTVLRGHIETGALSERSIAISTYALCGFANFASIGIQIGGLGVLAPGRRSDLARLGLKAMLGGVLASWLTAAIASLML